VAGKRQASVEDDSQDRGEARVDGLDEEGVLSNAFERPVGNGTNHEVQLQDNQAFQDQAPVALESVGFSDLRSEAQNAQQVAKNNQAAHPKRIADMLDPSKAENDINF